MKIEVLNDYKLEVGDYCTIWFAEENNPHCYADCTYKGKRKGKYVFESNTYGWKYYLDRDSGIITNSDFGNKIMKVNNDSGWMKCLP